MAHKKIPITVAEGDGIGPEIMDATLRIIEAAGANLEIHKVQIGEKVYLSGEPTGISRKTWDTILNTEAFLKAPITTPQGGGFKSLNVTIRATLGLYANVRPCVAYSPFVLTNHPGMDVVIVRENEEDLYTGIEYRQTPDVFEALKIITRPGCERIIRYAFEYARSYKRKKVTCFTKDNILKLTDGLFHKVFLEIAAEYPDIENEHWIVDIGAAKLADTPKSFDVVVMPNLYGDILSDVAAQIAGSVGLAGSANIGQKRAMFEAIHGSAPRRAAQNLANPSGLILASVMMLVHLGENDAATQIHNGWLKTLEEGIHTYDIFKENTSRQKVGTKEFAAAVIARLGQKPEQLKAVNYTQAPINLHSKDKKTKIAQVKKDLVGVDVFIQYDEGFDKLKAALSKIKAEDIKLSMIANRGVKVWPNDIYPEADFVNHWRCRFITENKGKFISHKAVVDLLGQLVSANLDFTQTELLFNYEGQPGYTLAQDEQ